MKRPSHVSSVISAVVAAFLFAFGLGTSTNAQVLTNHALDLTLQGDDPGEVFLYKLAGNSLAPVMVRLDGYFQNLDTVETGVRYDVMWTAATGGQVIGSAGVDFTRLPGSGQWSMNLEQPIAFTPSTVSLHLEGGGPSDHFRFVGNLEIMQVPEPTIYSLFSVGSLLGLFWMRSRK